MERQYYVTNVSPQPLPLFAYVQEQDEEPSAKVEQLMPGKCCAVSRVQVYKDAVWLEVAAGFAGSKVKVQESCWLRDEPGRTSATADEERSRFYRARVDAVPLYGGPRRTATYLGEGLKRFECCRCSSRRYDPTANELWAKIDDAKERWVCVSDCESSGLCLEEIDDIQPVTYFLNVYSRSYARGELPLRDRPSLFGAKKIAALPNFLVVKGSVALVGKSAETNTTDAFTEAIGTMWIEITGCYGGRSDDGAQSYWAVQANAKTGVVVLEPLPANLVGRHTTSDDSVKPGGSDEGILVRNVCSTSALSLISKDDFLEICTARAEEDDDSSDASSVRTEDSSRSMRLTSMEFPNSKLYAKKAAKTLEASLSTGVATVLKKTNVLVPSVAGSRRLLLQGGPVGGLSSPKTSKGDNHHAPYRDDDHDDEEEPSSTSKKRPVARAATSLGAILRARQVVVAPNGEVWAECAYSVDDFFWAKAIIDGQWTLQLVANDDKTVGPEATTSSVSAYRCLDEVVTRPAPRAASQLRTLPRGAVFVGADRVLDDRRELWIKVVAGEEDDARRRSSFHQDEEEEEIRGWVPESAGGKQDSVVRIYPQARVSRLAESFVRDQKRHHDYAALLKKQRAAAAAKALLPPPKHRTSASSDDDASDDDDAKREAPPSASEFQIDDDASDDEVLKDAPTHCIVDAEEAGSGGARTPRHAETSNPMHPQGSPLPDDAADVLSSLDDFAVASARADSRLRDGGDSRQRNDALRGVAAAAGLDDDSLLSDAPPRAPTLRVIRNKARRRSFFFGGSREQTDARFPAHLATSEATLLVKVSSKDERATIASLRVVATARIFEEPLVRQVTKTRIRGVFLPKSSFFALEDRDLPPDPKAVALEAVVLFDDAQTGRRVASRPARVKHKLRSGQPAGFCARFVARLCCCLARRSPRYARLPTAASPTFGIDDDEDDDAELDFVHDDDDGFGYHDNPSSSKGGRHKPSRGRYRPDDGL